MEVDCSRIPYKSTNSFSSLVNEYVENNENFKQFIFEFPSYDTIQLAIKQKSLSPINRKVLIEQLRKNYVEIGLSEKQETNLQNLLHENCFTITTAHQPNIFTGPLYFIYKIIHAIKLADDLNNRDTKHNFIPIYYLGSEDADLDELGNFTVQSTKRVWNTTQTGAVGRMQIDKNFLQLIEELKGQIGVLPFGMELIEHFKTCYTIGKSIQLASLQLVNTLFSSYGLLVLIPDDAILKRTFNHVITKELMESFSHQEVIKTNELLSKKYKIQAGGRDINLFYLIDDKRERIERSNNSFTVNNLDLKFTQDEILNEVETYPERFSANVILRPVFQETILPNIVFIGGGGEIAYWLQLKKVFESTKTPYPILLLRNSFLLYNSKEKTKIENIGFSTNDFFSTTTDLLNRYVQINSDNDVEITQELNELNELINATKIKAANIDPTLEAYVESIKTKTSKLFIALEKKMFRAEKRKFETQKNQIEKLKLSLFPNNNLQEREENFAHFYAQHGTKFIQMLYDNSNSLEQTFGLIEIK